MFLYFLFFFQKQIILSFDVFRPLFPLDLCLPTLLIINPLLPGFLLRKKAGLQGTTAKQLSYSSSSFTHSASKQDTKTQEDKTKLLISRLDEAAEQEKKRDSRAKIKIRETCPTIIKSLTKSTNLTAITCRHKTWYRCMMAL